MIRPTTRELPHAVRLAAVAAGGVVVTFLVARATAMSSAEASELSAIAAGAALTATLVGAAVLHATRRHSFATQIAASALIALAAAVAGIWAAAEAMFVSDQEVGALSVILAAAATVATITALVTGRRIGRAVDALVGDARTLGDDQAARGRTERHFPAELAHLREELSRSTTRLESARRRERALDASRRELIAWVSHDLRTPLAGIRALAEALEDRVANDPETIARYHTALRVETDRLSGLVDDLFELSRTQAGVLHLELQRVSLRDLVSDAIASATPIAAAKGVHLEGRIDEQPLELMASTPEVLRALRNILENAIRHTPTDGTVTVEAGAAEQSAYVSIVDTGGGIPTQDLVHVFDVAFRGDPARTPGDGAGLGLAIARGLIEAHHGHISVRNDNGGARFTISLPVT